MLMKIKKVINDVFFSLAVIGMAYALNSGLDCLFATKSHTTTLFVLGVFLIAIKTEGYIYGIAASLLSVVAVNFAFTYPYYKLDFLSPKNLISAVVMLIIVITTSTLTTKVKEQEKIKKETEMEKMRANLLRAISHDLRTPLTSIYGATSAIIENYDNLDREHQIKLLKEVKNDSEWLIRMVENLLSVTRIDGGRVELVKSPVVVEELIDAVLMKFQKRYPKQRVIVSIPDEFVMVYADALLIEQVLMNLLENAVLHAEGMKELKLSVRVEDNKAVFEVADDGCGIHKENGKHTNENNGQISASTAPIAPIDGKKRSMGIGLSVCSAIVKAHGGDLVSANRAEGGAVFSFKLEMGV